MRTGSLWDTVTLNLSRIPILAATRATLPDLRLVKLNISKNNGWKSRPLTPSFPQTCQCLSRVLSSHTELTALFIRGLGMSGQGSTFHSRSLRCHQMSHWTLLSYSAPGKVCTIILILQMNKQRSNILPRTPREHAAPEFAPHLGTPTLGLFYAWLPEPVGMTINWIMFTPPLPTVILFCSLSCSLILLQSILSITERCDSPVSGEL